MRKFLKRNFSLSDLFVFPICMIFLYPFYFLVISTFKTFREITAEPQNYLFYLQRHTKDGDKIIYMDAAIRGEQVTDAALLNGKPGAVLDKMLAALRDEVSHW